MGQHLDKETAAEVLKPILTTLRQCIEEAWAGWKTFYAPKHTVLDARARAAIVNCHIIERAKTLFNDTKDVKIGSRNGIFRLFVGGEIALRFKKARRDGSTSNISTNQQKLIDMQLTIPGILPGTMLNAVYLLDQIQQDIKDMQVTLQLNRRVKWSIPLPQELAGPSAVMPSPQLPSAPQTPRRARVKGQISNNKRQMAE